MPKLLLDFTNVNIDEPTPVPAGVYDAVVDASRIELRNSQAGNEVLSVPFVIQNHPEYSGRVVFENYALTDKAKWKLGQLLKAVGLLDSDNPKFVLDTDSLHNKRVRIQVGIEDYNGRQRNRVQRVEAPNNGEGNSSSAKKLINF
ncbi:DUF669 domain-containing protein [Caldanaerobius polysaccharolyticus]|uniref:DUF669 domain-containing protein n=1 Tax=Caldanaerobius polysaccharolyticus TaxID=44256 RepID=UPI00047D5F98|nr:DUF669 domain-containing protein [Caldanaerobius polysaccharolyticus]